MAAGREVFKIYGTFSLDGADDANKQLGNLDKNAGNTDKKMSGFGNTMRKVGKGVAVFGTAAIAAGTALVGIAKKGATATDNIDKMSQKLNFSREGFQEWDFILSQNGASIDGLQMGMKTLSGAIYEAGQGTGTYVDALADVGLSYEDLQGQKPEEQFETVFAALQGVEDQTTRTALASDLLGRSATELAPALNQSAEALEAQREQAHELGLVLGDDVIDAGVQTTDLFDQLTRTLQGGFMKIIGQMLPMINQLVELLISKAPEIMTMIEPIFTALMPILPVLIDAGLQILDALLPLLPLVAQLITELLPPLIELIMPIIDLLLQILTQVIPPLIPVITALATVLTSVLGTAFEALKPLIDSIMLIFGGLIDFITGVFTGDWEMAWGGIIDIFAGIFEGIVNLVKLPINTVIGLINKLFASIGQIDLPDFLGGGSIGLPQIPLLAKGTDYFQGGMAIVGEEGAELVNMPRGSSVTPANETREMLNSGNTNIYVNGDTSPSGIIRAQRKKQWIDRMRLA